MGQSEAETCLPIRNIGSQNRAASFPDVLLYRGRAGDGEECLATFDRHTVLLSRAVADLPCRIRLSVRQYQAVAVIVTAGLHTVRLLHAEDGLSVDLAEIDDLEAAEEYCGRLASFLQLPSVTMGAGRAGGKPSAPASPGRTRLAKQRRARFLTRRRTGNVIHIRKLEKREIIARG